MRCVFLCLSFGIYYEVNPRPQVEDDVRFSNVAKFKDFDKHIGVAKFSNVAKSNVVRNLVKATTISGYVHVTR